MGKIQSFPLNIFFLFFNMMSPTLNFYDMLSKLRFFFFFFFFFFFQIFVPYIVFSL